MLERSSPRPPPKGGGIVSPPHAPSLQAGVAVDLDKRRLLHSTSLSRQTRRDGLDALLDDVGHDGRVDADQQNDPDHGHQRGALPPGA